MELNKRYIIDLSQAQSPADIVFELSNIIEKPEASHQKIWLKLGDIHLNQSQLLSIQSLISSINSTLSLIESQSQQTELAAATLGICTKDVEEEIEKELEENTPEAPLNTEDEKPTEQYIPMTDHLLAPDEAKESQEQSINNTEEQEETKENNEILTEEDKSEPSSHQASLFEINEQTAPIIEAEKELDNETEETTGSSTQTDETVKDNIEELKPQEETVPSVNEEEIQEQLDSIFDSETKLENILSDDKDINEMKNWPLTKEANEFEIPEEVMTDEDYAILQMNTQYHKQTVRSGQVIQSNGNVVIIGDCHPGCEVHAAGDITVWGVLGGIAHAGCKGNTKARIRALNLNAIQLRIADSYARRPDYIKNTYVEKTNTFTPEEARNINGSIVILKIND